MHCDNGLWSDARLRTCDWINVGLEFSGWRRVSFRSRERSLYSSIGFRAKRKRADARTPAGFNGVPVSLRHGQGFHVYRWNPDTKKNRSYLEDTRLRPMVRDGLI